MNLVDLSQRLQCLLLPNYARRKLMLKLVRLFGLRLVIEESELGSRLCARGNREMVQDSCCELTELSYHFHPPCCRHHPAPSFLAPAYLRPILHGPDMHLY